MKTKDFDPENPEWKNEVSHYQRGVKDTIKKFNTLHTSDYYNQNIEQKQNETTEQYIKRLKGDCIDLLCSNRGYASCFANKNN